MRVGSAFATLGGVWWGLGVDFYVNQLTYMKCALMSYLNLTCSLFYTVLNELTDQDMLKFVRQNI